MMKLTGSGAVFLLLVLLGLLSQGQTVPGRPFQSESEDKDRQDIISLAARILKIALAGDSDYLINDKRNSGTMDALFNLPHLLSVGKRR